MALKRELAAAVAIPIVFAILFFTPAIVFHVVAASIALAALWEFYRLAEKTGIFRGQCAELCGKEHGFMPVVVEVKSADDYAKWLDERKKRAAASADDPGKVWDLNGLIARGEKVYAANCVACHQATGKGVPGAFPALDGSPVVNGPKQAQIMTVLNGVVRDGKPTAMVAWKNTLSDTDIAAVITFTRNSWGNHTGEAIQPSDVKADRS